MALGNLFQGKGGGLNILGAAAGPGSLSEQTPSTPRTSRAPKKRSTGVNTMTSTDLTTGAGDASSGYDSGATGSLGGGMDSEFMTDTKTVSRYKHGSSGRSRRRGELEDAGYTNVGNEGKNTVFMKNWEEGTGTEVMQLDQSLHDTAEVDVGGGEQEDRRRRQTATRGRVGRSTVGTATPAPRI